MVLLVLMDTMYFKELPIKLNKHSKSTKKFYLMQVHIFNWLYVIQGILTWVEQLDRRKKDYAMTFFDLSVLVSLHRFVYLF